MWIDSRRVKMLGKKAGLYDMIVLIFYGIFYGVWKLLGCRPRVYSIEWGLDQLLGRIVGFEHADQKHLLHLLQLPAFGYTGVGRRVKLLKSEDL